MRIGTEYSGVALVDGRIDATNARDFERAMRTVSLDSSGLIVLDCQDLSYVSSAGLRVMVIVARTLRERKKRFALCSVSKPISDILQTSGLDRIIPVHPSLQEALGAAD